MNQDQFYMRRALQLARYGLGHTGSNPMVGAVIVAPGDRIIGEGWHRRYGGSHAEVNAINSVSAENQHLLAQSTIYVTLEPCSHYGKTPPCSLLIIEKGIPRIVVGTGDPFPQVAGRGIRMLREAGREVVEGVLEKECYDLNLRFMTAHKRGYPYVQLKWAQTADGFISAPAGAPRLLISNPVSTVWMHRERVSSQAIMVGTDTVITDNPSLTSRLWPGDSPLPVTFDSPRLPEDAAILKRQHVLRMRGENILDFLKRLYTDYHILSLMVEGGAKTLQEFIDTALFDEIRVEINPSLRLPDNAVGGAVRAPHLPAHHSAYTLTLHSITTSKGNEILTYRKTTP